MNVLITAGGTRTALDPVRWFGNVSRGVFGQQIARRCLTHGAHVTHLHAVDAPAAWQHTIDLRSDDASKSESSPWTRDAASIWPRYRSATFGDVWDYERGVQHWLCSEPFDIVFLSAAVSDYAPDTNHAAKIASDQDELIVRLRRVPKVIEKVKDWAPHVFQVGFKLLVDVPKDALIAAARTSGRKYRSDVTVANDLALLQKGAHTIHLVRDGHPVETCGPDNDPADMLVRRVFQWYQEWRASQ